MIARGKDGIPELEKITGDTVDITEYVNFAFLDLIWFGDDPEDGTYLRRWLGIFPLHWFISMLSCTQKQQED